MIFGVQDNCFLEQENAKDLFFLTSSKTFLTAFLVGIAASDSRLKAENTLYWKGLVEFVQWKLLDLTATLSEMTWMTCYSFSYVNEIFANAT